MLTAKPSNNFHLLQGEIEPRDIFISGIGEASVLRACPLNSLSGTEGGTPVEPIRSLAVFAMFHLFDARTVAGALLVISSADLGDHLCQNTNSNSISKQEIYDGAKGDYRSDS